MKKEEEKRRSLCGNQITLYWKGTTLKKKSFLMIFAIMLCATVFFDCSKLAAQPASAATDAGDALKKDELVVGMALDFNPFETTDADGNPIGIGVDMARDLGKALGKKIRIENMARNGLIPALKTKKIDMIISSMTITDERSKTIDFSKPYAKGWMALLINKKSPVKAVGDLNVKGRKIAIQTGTIAYDYAVKKLPNAEILLFEDNNTCMLEVIQGKTDAMIYDQITVYDTWKKNEATTRVNLEPIDGKMSWGVGIGKENKDLTEKVNNFIDEYKKDGGFDRLAEKYLSEKKKVFEEQGIPFFFD